MCLSVLQYPLIFYMEYTLRRSNEREPKFSCLMEPKLHKPLMNLHLQGINKETLKLTLDKGLWENVGGTELYLAQACS